jgi:hypothetical protein
MLVNLTLSWEFERDCETTWPLFVRLQRKIDYKETLSPIAEKRLAWGCDEIKVQIERTDLDPHVTFIEEAFLLFLEVTHQMKNILMMGNFA